MPAIEFRGVTKSYTKDNIVLDHIELTIEHGEFVTIIGPSGCGKTTLIKLVNHLMDWDHGDLLVYDKKIKEWDTIELRRSIGYVIQQIGLFPHMTVGENISYVLNIMGEDKEKCRNRALELLELVQLDAGLIDRHPWSLSGGQAQRVGVARALAADPEVILMDEPFGAVDEITRRVLQDEIKKLHNRLGKTILFVTHDIEEALKLGTRIVLMNEGKVEQIGSKEDMIFRPKTDFVSGFFGHKNFSAYLGITKLSEVMQPIDEVKDSELLVKYSKKSLILDGNSFILDAIRLMMLYNEMSVGVSVDGVIVGKYQMDHLMGIND